MSIGQGERGDSGDRGVDGERGPKGDHGQDGQDGRHGLQGKDGVKGPAGPIGKTGPTSPYLGRNRTLAIFAFIVLAFLLLAYRTEVAANKAHDGLYQACQARAEISRLTNTLPGSCEMLR